jgi:DNA-binding beta-propeller fold protein YncE
VSPDGRTVYEAGGGRISGRGSYIAVRAYDAETGRQRWLRYYTRVKPGGAALGVAVSPDGSAVYVAGEAGALEPGSYQLLLLAYQASGTLRWATRYANRYTGGKYAGGAFAGPIVLGPGGNDLYVAGSVSSKYGHHVAATFAFRAATGTFMWLDPDRARGGGGKIAVTPDGQTVIFVGDRTGNGYAITSYNANTGLTRWARRAPVPANASLSGGLVIDPHGRTAFVASPEYGGGHDLAAWSVARGTVRWTAGYTAAKVYSPVAIALSPDGTRVFVTGTVGSSGTGMTTVAYQT